ncbi:anthranilate synthase component II [Parathalassolituus penaei]|uniref:Aminodeoxychorismate/anthranilate synthase component II n=1 Tax=Parathalassolituus penaei TaxID=2997323 RepID=A0A9X3ITR0_9GAMM|nr:aminodeoxychorismate/anthranilate synthase component II [Parathalassolituus penaei]MCY0965423.1 aminodeoxychorismate/anthranilate synthase component II [Parathalassolituus penaei]
MKVLIIDNYDSFTYNLYQYVGEILQSRQQPGGFEIVVKRNNEITLQQAFELAPDRVIISPGPGSPDDKAYFGVCADVILEMGKTTPVLGVCLGMQGIAHYFGGDVVRASRPMHGKTSTIAHDDKGLHRGLPQGIDIMRYHSLMVAADTLPDCLEITSVVQQGNESLADAIAAGGEIMGVRHKQYPIEGIQYHPESFASEGGKDVLVNFLLQR